MARDSRGYYSRSIKAPDGRVKREYVGKGPEADEAAREDARRRGEEAADRDFEELERSRLAELDAEASGAEAAGDRLALGAVERAGFRRNKRGRWQRRKGGPDLTPAPALSFQLAAVETDAEAALMRRFQAGEAGLLPAVRQTLAAYGSTATLPYSDLARLVEDNLLASAPLGPLMVEGLRRRLELMRSELAGPDPSPVEALLAARVSLAWLHAHVADLARAVTDSTSTRHLRYLDDRAASSERRLLAACKALATVRRLGVPSILARLTAPCTS